MGNIWRAGGDSRRKTTHRQLKRNSRGRAGQGGRRAGAPAAAFIALPGTPPSLLGWEGTNADPAPVRTLAGKGGEEILGAALALPKPSSYAAGGGGGWFGLERAKRAPRAGRDPPGGGESIGIRDEVRGEGSDAGAGRGSAHKGFGSIPGVAGAAQTRAGFNHGFSVVLGLAEVFFFPLCF